MSKRIDFFDGAQTSTVPTIGNISASDLVKYANDADYEANEQGAPIEGNIYFSTDLNLIRYYNGTEWISAVDETSAQTLENKTIDGTSATGNNTVTTDADQVTYDNTSSGTVATDVQGALDEVEGRVDTNENDIAQNTGDIGDLQTLSGSPGGTDHGTFTGSTIPDNSTTKDALQALETDVEGKLDASEKGAPNGVAELDGSGLVPASQLPSYVDDVIEAADFASLPATGESGKIYVTLDDNKTFRWTGSAYIEVSASDVTDVNGQTGAVSLDTDDIPEGTNEYYTEAKVDAVIAGASIDELADVDTTTVAPSVDDALVWDGSNWVPGAGGGSGTGVGGITYIFADFEEDTTALVAYQDAAGDRPVDGTGGTPNVTVAAETVNPLIGTQSARISKDAANRQGEGAAILSQTVDDAYSDKVHTVELLWKTDANYASGDMSLWVVHPTTGTVEALNFRTALGEYTNELPASDSTVTRIVSELTPIDDTYRIVLHVASTSGTAYDVFVDNIQCGPQRTFNAPIVTEWESFTPTGTWTTNATYSGKYRRVGDSAEVQVHIVTGGVPSGGALQINIPSGLVIDLAKLPEPSFSSQAGNVGFGAVAETGIRTYGVSVTVISSTAIGVLNSEPGTGSNSVSPTVPFSFNATDTVRINFKVPIQGWDAGAAFSTTQVDQQTVKAFGFRNTNQTHSSSGSYIDVEINAVEYDDFGIVNTSSPFDVTVKEAGEYLVIGTVQFASGTASQRAVALNVDGSQVAETIVASNGSAVTHITTSKIITLTPNNSLNLQAFQDTGGSLSILGGSNKTYLQVVRIPDFTVFGTFPEKNLVQTKILSSSVSTNGDIHTTTDANFIFNNLTIGKTYHVHGKVALQNNATDTVSLEFQNGATEVDRISSATATNATLRYGVNFVFTATDTQLFFTVSGAGGGDSVLGNGTRQLTFIQLEERNDLAETSKFN